jgi:hypothetical protein
MSFENAAMLIGLVAIAIPPIIHLLNRRRYDVIDWGAMQFLQISEVTRRRLLIEEILLMALRMVLIAVLVLSLADPRVQMSLFSGGQPPNRDIVLVIDGSASMTYKNGDKSAHDLAQEWATNFLNSLHAGDSVAVLVARKQPVLIAPKLTRDLEHVRDHLHRLPEPSGGSNLAGAVKAAYRILDDSHRRNRDIIILSDGQRYGWADEQSLRGWNDLANKYDSAVVDKPRLWAVNLDPQRPAKPANWSLAPLVASRAVVAANQEITFRTAILLSGPTKYEPPYEIRVELDGKLAFKLDPPKEAKLEGGQVPLRFELKIPKYGSHLVSVILEPDPPKSQRPAGYVLKDQLPIDNRRDFAIEVVNALPVLLVDGEEKTDVPTRSSNFLRDALSPARDETPVIKTRVQTISEFTPASLRDDAVNGKGEDRPRVLILNNVPRLNPVQQQAVETFLREGGGVLVTAGERVDGDWYNANLYVNGKGWLPGKFDKMQGDESSMSSKWSRPIRESLTHPALAMFRRPGVGGLDIATFARWWKLIPPDISEAGSVIAKLDQPGNPLFLEGKRGDGRIILSAVPLDNSWRTNLTDLPAYVPLTHELIYYLASARASEHNLEPGQPLRYRLPKNASQAGLTLQSPSDKEPKPLVIGTEEDDKHYLASVSEQAQGPLLIHEGMIESGVWKLNTADKQTIFYVVQPDAREADLTPFDESDKKGVEEYVKVGYENEVDNLIKLFPSKSPEQEFWWWFLLGVILLLCSEVWFTRKIVKSRA